MTLRIGSISLSQDEHKPFEAISDWIASMGADILLVSGFRTGMRGMMLRAALDRLGLVYQTPCDTEPEMEALILGSRCPFLQVDIPEALATHRPHFLHVCIGDFHIIGSDLSGHTLPATLQDYMLAQAERLQRDKLLVFSRCANDAQTASDQKTSKRPQTDDTLAAMLARLGFLDAYQFRPHPPRGENLPFNFRVTPALAPQLSRCFQESPPSNDRELHAAVLNMG